MILSKNLKVKSMFCATGRAKFAETPLYILVENRFSDGVFLKRIVKELHKDLLNYWMESVDAIKIDSVGGIGQMDRMVEEYVMGKSLRPRMVVIADSDKKSSNAIVRKTVKRLRETCEKYSIPCWILAKRENENYLPQGLLQNFCDEDPILFVAWNKLTEDEKDFYNMKEGYKKDGFHPSLSDKFNYDEIDALMKGFGSGISKLWETCDPILKSELVT